MKFVSFKDKKAVGFGILDEKNQQIINLKTYFHDQGLDIPDLRMFIHYGELHLDDITEFSAQYNVLVEDVEIIAPIMKPAKNIVCVGKNYRDHAIEMGSEKDIPKHPMIFTKAPTTVSNPDQVLTFERELAEALDYEGELAIVIGKEGKGINMNEAMEYVFGYTIINDLTARDLQKKHGQFFVGKSLDQSCPMGPAIVHKSSLVDPHQLTIVTKVNGDVRQNGSTSDFIFNIPELIHVLSKGMTLEPGDIIATGTPAGVGKGFNPPKYLGDGDVIEIDIEGIGTLRNEISIR
ncbi:fumarylacetoacetate hydrolase family protein [Bacillus sp. es.036]|uniref:fumarylacetoacetate hydrolase family protein n=1 Tax=Bacillus sp. es.036 TaxID=1761764 RepID=UPI000BF4D6C9|nr:fumarylacetoacetate hydrolase family protein [Bacillus sp. es.036]PFG12625.1 2-keto-4-pentenoate hydratase/2-oxohepta-3-ene-1,7-dioic acid hydratase in catechol pathway [Bacillus sp. es.036]